jgi:hypothetical protein
MAKQNEHGRLVTAAAKAALAPLGCRRKGQSRLWYSDQRFWIISIEFQPSSWSKGSYLNVGAAWLWHARAGLGFDEGYRIAEFVPFESTKQFAPLITAMAARAREEVVALRAKFRSVSDIYSYLLPRARQVNWRTYHAAVAAGLVGDVATSRDLFHRFDDWSSSSEWQTKLQSESAALAALLDDPIRYRSRVLTLIEKRRMLTGLPPDPHCLDDATNPTARP